MNHVQQTSPVFDEIRYACDEKRTGVLALHAANGKRVEIFFREGLIEAVTSNLNARRIGDYLVKDGYLDVQDVNSVQSEASRHKITFGEAAVKKQLLRQADISAAVRSQAIDLVEYVLRNDFSVDSFTGSLRSYHAPARLSFSNILLELCRNNAAPLETVPETRFILSNSSDLSTFPWYPQELSILAELKVPRTVEELANRTSISETKVKRILGVLESLSVLDIVQAGDSISPSTALTSTEEFAFLDLIPVVTNAVLHEKLEVARNESSFTSEQFKNLKVQIRQANPQGPIKVITVSSPDAEDGKSLVAANLAFSFALDPGRRVAVVDCDLRNPALEKYLGVPTEPGLLQYLGNGHLSPYCYVRRLENLYFLTAGGSAPSPIEILSMRKMKDLIERLKKDFDTIILDAPPYSPISDARIVTGLSDALLMVVRCGKTSYSSIDQAFAAIDRNKFLGVVFNDVKPMLLHSYQKYDHYQYGQEQQVSKIRSPRRNYLES